MWRDARPSDDDAITRMCLALNAEDPGPAPVPPDHVRRTLRALRDTPWRGRAVVLDIGDRACGYAFFVSSWSNELGGEVCVIDELYVDPERRARGHATRLIESLADGTAPWARTARALTLEVTPDNTRARRLYLRLGFRERNLALRRLLVR